MNLEDGLATLVRQEHTLRFSHFDEATAWQLGSHLYAQAETNAWPVVVDVRRFDRLLFCATTPGSSSNNHEWVRRKSNTVRHFLCSSYRIRYQLALEHQSLAQRYSLAEHDFASVGGGFPIYVQGAGVIGSVTVSGLPDRQDHQIIVDALCELLKYPANELSLPAHSPF